MVDDFHPLCQGNIVKNVIRNHPGIVAFLPFLIKRAFKHKHKIPGASGNIWPYRIPLPPSDDIGQTWDANGIRVQILKYIPHYLNIIGSIIRDKSKYISIVYIIPVERVHCCRVTVLLSTPSWRNTQSMRYCLPSRTEKNINNNIGRWNIGAISMG